MQLLIFARRCHSQPALAFQAFCLPQQDQPMQLLGFARQCHSPPTLVSLVWVSLTCCLPQQDQLMQLPKFAKKRSEGVIRGIDAARSMPLSTLLAGLNIRHVGVRYVAHHMFVYGGWEVGRRGRACCAVATSLQILCLTPPLCPLCPCRTAKDLARVFNSARELQAATAEQLLSVQGEGDLCGAESMMHGSCLAHRCLAQPTAAAAAIVAAVAAKDDTAPGDDLLCVKLRQHYRLLTK